MKREPERNHLSCVTLKTDYSEVSSVLKNGITQKYRRVSMNTCVCRSRFTRLPPRFLAASPLDSPPLFSTPLYHVLHTHYLALHGGYSRTKDEPTIMVNMWVLILFYLTLQDLKKEHVYTYCLSTVYRVGAQYSRIRNLGFLKLHFCSLSHGWFSCPKWLKM